MYYVAILSNFVNFLFYTGGVSSPSRRTAVHSAGICGWNSTWCHHTCRTSSRLQCQWTAGQLLVSYQKMILLNVINLHLFQTFIKETSSFFYENQFESIL